MLNMTRPVDNFFFTLTPKYMGFWKMPFDNKKRNYTIQVEDTENFIEYV